MNSTLTKEIPKRNMNCRTNYQIRIPTVRLIDETGKMLGIVSNSEAIRMAQDRELDLVEVDANQRPPICKIMDYGKFMYETAKKEKEARKAGKTLPVKEIQFSPSVDVNDMQIKTRKIREFLEEGHKVRLTMRFRGREMQHTEIGKGLFKSLLTSLEDVSKIEQSTEFTGNTLSSLISRK